MGSAGEDEPMLPPKKSPGKTGPAKLKPSAKVRGIESPGKKDESVRSPRQLSGIIDPDKLSPAAQARRVKVFSQKDELTKRISESTRTLAFGSLAACYGLLIADKDLAPLFASSKPLLFWSAGAAISAIIADAAQYLFGYINAKQALQRKDQKYPENWSRGWRHICFIAKQVLAYLAALLLLITMAGILVPGPMAPPTESVDNGAQGT
jgi:hypothetical protein